MTDNSKPYSERAIQEYRVMYPAVIDWLQYYDFKTKLGELDMPQLTLSLIKYLKSENESLSIKIKELESKDIK